MLVLAEGTDASGRSALVVASGAQGVVRSVEDGNPTITYRVSDPYPAARTIRSLRQKLRRGGWLETGLPTVTGHAFSGERPTLSEESPHWKDVGALPCGPRKQWWYGHWSHSNGGLVIYSLWYECAERAPGGLLLQVKAMYLDPAEASRYRELLLEDARNPLWKRLWPLQSPPPRQ